MVALFLCFSCFFLLTYNGAIRFNDELQMFDITGSIVQHQDEKYDVALWYVWTNYGPLGQESTLYPLPNSPIEPLQSLVGFPFYSLGDYIANVGRVHLVWLVNVLVSAALCTLMFAYGRLLGYGNRAALLGAVALGVLTIIWPYSKTFLREPMAAFWILLAAYFGEWVRRGRWWWSIGVVISVVMAYLTKESTLMFLPALVAVLLLPIQVSRRVGLIALGLIWLLPLILIFTDLATALFPDMIHVTGNYWIQAEYVRTALHTYLLSIGGSIWGTSPILLLALPGGYLLLKARKSRYLWVATLALLTVAILHAFTTGQFWTGGATWQPRFLLPVIPFLMLLALPVFEKLAYKPRPKYILIPVVLLSLYSLWWQVNATAFSWYAYPELVPEGASGQAEWGPGLNELRYLRPTLLTQLWGNEPLDFAWVQAGANLWAFAILSLMTFLAFAVWRMQNNARWRWVIYLAPIPFMLIVFGLLSSSYIDPNYMGDRQPLHDIHSILDEIEQPDDLVLLSSPLYHEFFMNFNQLDHARVVALPLAPGERGSFEEKPVVEFDDPAELLQPSTLNLIQAMTAAHDRLFILMDNGPFLPWSIRPLERFMSQNYYLVREYTTDPTVRLLEYWTPRLQLEDIIRVPTDIRFGDDIELAGYWLPEGDTFEAGDIIPINLFWQTDADLDENYTVALFLTRDGEIVFSGTTAVQGWDTQPDGGFAPTSEWLPDTFYQDNRGLRLPDDLPAGEYQLALRLYESDSGGTDTLQVVGVEVLNGDVAILPTLLIVRD